MRRAACGGMIFCLLAGSAAAQAPAWKPVHGVDAITDAARDGYAYENGEESFKVVCTRQKNSSAHRFWVEVTTGAHLGRGNMRAITYRIGDEAPTTARWEYSTRNAMPFWPMEDRHLVERMVEHKAERAVFRLTAFDGTAHDVTIPIDASARDGMAQTLERCKA